MTYHDSKNRVNVWGNAFLAALGSFLGAAGLSAGSASAGSAPSETVLYSFCQQTNCTDGNNPEAGLIATSQGAFYGTTENGGNANEGVAFLLAPTGAYMILHAFQANSMDGGIPGPLFRDKSGNLFGTTAIGGASQFGTVFKLSASGGYTVLHEFNGNDGLEPSGGLVADNAGNLYGMTSGGGADNEGTIFKLTPKGFLTTLYSFCSMTGCTDGRDPVGGLIGDANGNLYGTTFFGGGKFDSGGVVFKIHADGTGYTVLHSFPNGASDGQNPIGLSADPSGTLYGTTVNGGTNANGTVFKIAPDGSNYAVLYNFCNVASCADGALPAGGVILDAGGKLYGPTERGGANNRGVVFSLTPSGTETVLYSFCSLAACADGSFPGGNLVALFPGNLYGTTSIGGTTDNGTVYQVTNTGFVP